MNVTGRTQLSLTRAALCRCGVGAKQIPVHSSSWANSTLWLAPGAPEPLLLRCFAQGDPGAFWLLWLAHRDFLFQLCSHYLDGRRADAEDALERVWQKALAGLPRVALQMTNLKAWLGRVAVNVCRDIQREDHCRRWELTDMNDTAAEGDEPFASADLDPGETLLLHELEEVLRGAIHDLPPGLRPAAQLFFLEDCSPDEVARALAITVANAHKRIQRARALLKAAVAAYLSEKVCPKPAPSSVVQVKVHETAWTPSRQEALATGPCPFAGKPSAVSLPRPRAALPAWAECPRRSKHRGQARLAPGSAECSETK